MRVKKAENNLGGLGFLKRDKEKNREAENAEFKEIESEKEGSNVSNTEARSSKIKAEEYLLDLVIRKPYWPKGALIKVNTGLQRAGNR